MSDQFNQNQYNQNPYRNPKQNGFASTALLMGIIAFFTMLLVLPPLIIAPLGIIFAILSRGSEKKIPALGKAGIGVCVGAFTISLFITVYTLTQVIPNMNMDVLSEYQEKVSEGTVTEDDLRNLYENLYTPEK